MKTEMPEPASDPQTPETGQNIAHSEAESASKSIFDLLKSKDLVYGKSIFGGDGPALVFAPRPMAERLCVIMECLWDTWGEFKQNYPSVAQDVLERDFLAAGAITFEQFCRENLRALREKSEPEAVRCVENRCDKNENDESPEGPSAAGSERRRELLTPADGSPEDQAELEPHSAPRPQAVEDPERPTPWELERLEEMYRELKEFRVPLDDEPWSRSFPVEDGDWPIFACQLMPYWMPPEILDQYGYVVMTVLNGPQWWIDPKFEKVVVSKLRKYGYRCRRDDRLIARMDGAEDLLT